MPESLMYQEVGPQENSPQAEEERTYFLDGTITSKWGSGQVIDISIKPFQASRELLSNTTIDAGNPGIISIVIAASELGDKTINDTISLGGITRTDKGLITQAASEILKPKQKPEIMDAETELDTKPDDDIPAAAA